MKKKIALFLIGVCTMTMVVGCGSKSEYSNENITMKNYKGVEVEKVVAPEVTDADVDQAIKTALESKATKNEVTGRPAQNGDIVTIDYEGKKDGVAFEGGTAQDYDLTLGSHSFIDGFEEGIVGHNVGETFDLNLTFPEGYPSEDLAGKAVVFTVTLDKISESIVPELSDELVKELSQTSKTVDEYKKEVREGLKASYKDTAEKQQMNAAWDAVMKLCEVKKYPEDKKKETVEQIKNQYGSVAQMYGMEDVDAFLEKAYGMKAEQMAENVLKQQMVIDLIVKNEKINVTDKEYKEGVKKYTAEFGYESEDALKEKVGEDQIKKALLQDEVTDWIMSNSKFVEKKEK